VSAEIDAGGTASWLGRAESDAAARWTMWVAWPLGLLVVIVISRNQWFARDDWAFIFTRERLRERAGLDAMLLTPQDGHWMTWPILVFRGLYNVVGTRSYFPYLIVLWATHIGAVVLARVWMRRFGVTAWISTLMTILLLVFGAGWENIIFAIQIVYNFSLLAFLGQLLLVDHEGPIDRRDGFGVLVSLIGVSSSGFGPFFAFGVGLLLVLRRRWLAGVVAVVPQALAWIWWWFTWGADPVSAKGSASLRFIVDWVEHGVWAVFGSLSATGLLAWPAFVLCLAMAAWPGTGSQRRMPIIAMLTTVLVMYAGIGSRREMFGVYASAWPRYQYMAAMIAAPTLALGLDQFRRFARWAHWIPRVVLLAAIARNIVWMHDGAADWGGAARDDRRLFSLVAGSDQRFDAPPNRSLSAFSPDVLLIDIDTLVDDGAITPVTPTTPEERAAVAAALGVNPP
jgi:hypothetical protein